jgi:hypothetical protein
VPCASRAADWVCRLIQGFILQCVGGKAIETDNDNQLSGFPSGMGKSESRAAEDQSQQECVQLTLHFSICFLLLFGLWIERVAGILDERGPVVGQPLEVVG